MRVYEFDAAIQKVTDKDAAFIEFPFDVHKEFGVKGQVKVKATFDGFEYRGSLAKMGLQCHILGMTKAVRNEISKGPGDTVHVVLIKDEEPRVIELPGDFSELLDSNVQAKTFFNELSHTKQKELVLWIESAKKAETRAKRLTESIFLLSDGKSRS